MKPDDYPSQHFTGVITCQIIENRSVCPEHSVLALLLHKLHLPDWFNSGKPALYTYVETFNMHFLPTCMMLHTYIHVYVIMHTRVMIVLCKSFIPQVKTGCDHPV